MKQISLAAACILVIATLVSAQAPGGYPPPPMGYNPSGDTNINNILASYTGVHDIGGGGAACTSPGWCPSATTWTGKFATCTYQPYPSGGRAVGLQMRHFNACTFPGNNSTTMSTIDETSYWFIYKKWVIDGTTYDNSMWSGNQTFEYFGKAECFDAQPDNPYQSWIWTITYWNSHNCGGAPEIPIILGPLPR